MLATEFVRELIRNTDPLVNIALFEIA